MDYKDKAKIWMKKPILDENRIKIGKIYFTSIMWMNVEIFCFIVIFYVASLASLQICKKKTQMVSLSISPSPHHYKCNVS
jgi:hypothetical protein